MNPIFRRYSIGTISGATAGTVLATTLHHGVWSLILGAVNGGGLFRSSAARTPGVYRRDLPPYDQMKGDFAGNFELSQRAACKTLLPLRYRRSQVKVSSDEPFFMMGSK
jgi:hypothetical protein